MSGDHVLVWHGRAELGGNVVALVEADPEALGLGGGKFGTEARLGFDPSGGSAEGLGQERLPAATCVAQSLEEVHDIYF